MTHFVLTRQQFHQYIIYAVTALLVSFAFGYWVGTESVVLRERSKPLVPKSRIEAHTQSDEQDVMSSNMLETNNTVKSQTTESQKNTSQEAEKTPVVAATVKPVTTSPTSTIIPKPSAPTPPPASVVQPVSNAVVTPPTPVVNKPAPAANSAPPVVSNQQATIKPVAAPANVSPTVPSSAPVVQSVVTKPAVTTPAVSPIQNAPVAVTTSPASTESSDTGAGFAVQVGVFSSQENATKLVEELIAKGFDAYSESFEGDGGETKYNVRFGRGIDREQVQKKLTRYKQLYSSSAYIIILK